MVNKKNSVYAKVGKIEYLGKEYKSHHVIYLKLLNLKFGEGNVSSFSILDELNLYLNDKTFLKITRHDWDTTEKCAKKLKKDLEGKVVELDFGFRYK